jgi:hypothetical protein
MKEANVTAVQKERLETASENLKEVLKRIAPFVKPTKIANVSTEGQWKKSVTTTTVLTSDDFQDAIRKVAHPDQGPAPEGKK